MHLIFSFFIYTTCLCMSPLPWQEGTGRVVGRKDYGLLNSLTLEASFCGPGSVGGRPNTQFTVTDYESMGSHICDTLLDYCDPDQAKVFFHDYY